MRKSAHVLGLSLNPSTQLGTDAKSHGTRTNDVYLGRDFDLPSNYAKSQDSKDSISDSARTRQRRWTP
jgi:hypothetical protein